MIAQQLLGKSIHGLIDVMSAAGECKARDLARRHDRRAGRDHNTRRAPHQALLSPMGVRNVAGLANLPRRQRQCARFGRSAPTGIATACQRAVAPCCASAKGRARSLPRSTRSVRSPPPPARAGTKVDEDLARSLLAVIAERQRRRLVMRAWEGWRFMSDEPRRSEHAPQETRCEDDDFLNDFELDADDGSLWGRLLPSETRWLDPHLVEPRAHRIGVLISADATGTSTVIIASLRRNLAGESARRPHLWLNHIPCRGSWGEGVRASRLPAFFWTRRTCWRDIEGDDASGRGRRYFPAAAGCETMAAVGRSTEALSSSLRIIPSLAS
jgi:hypothetical protein